MCHTVLYIGSSPKATDLDWLRIDKEFSQVQKATLLRKSEINFITEFGASLGDIGDVILDISPSIIHFSGHGSSSGELIFENERGQPKPADVDLLDRLFSWIVSATKQNINCVILNACHSEYLAESVAKYVDYVVGVRGSIEDEVATQFSLGFYKGLSNGMTPQKAFEFSCFRIAKKNLDASSLILTGKSIPFTIDKRAENVISYSMARLVADTVQSPGSKGAIVSDIDVNKPSRIDILGVDCFDVCHIQITLQCNTQKNIITNAKASTDGLSVELEQCIASFNKIVRENALFAIAKINENENTINLRWNGVAKKSLCYKMDEPPYLMLTLTSKAW